MRNKGQEGKMNFLFVFHPFYIICKKKKQRWRRKRVFGSERKHLSKLRHPNILKYYGGCTKLPNVTSVVEPLISWESVVCKLGFLKII